MNNKKPMIGVLPLYDSEKESYWVLPGYMKAIEEAGGIPVMLPLTSDIHTIKTLASSFEGFLFTGGQDVNPELYGEKEEEFCQETCSDRDIMENLLFEEILVLDKPVFGICRGLQIINVLLGGTLYQDLHAQFDLREGGHKQKHPYHEPMHRILIEKESPLYELMGGRESLMVNSLHHQGVKKISPKLTQAAYSEDGLAEAAYMPGKTFVFAVQWHPEFNFHKDPCSFRLFQAFTAACLEKKNAGTVQKNEGMVQG
ncbi:gamma-glutamyl-gamma-aminobutyrate hydrolase family protein [Evansella clarkii]|uniref:gamma-glutamyl-gamma-aminobutyrate hydrolase family protein n=1 Tax=Evansella clarkii TaxID=79879 RepID=UPI000B454272|nr:gamma-glutamyl-gamma-aminobutyrate hydrolase family protein [Evansella clarkii]